MAKKKWIQEAINPAHKGYCTPMTKSTCTPRRKALAKRFKSGDLSKKQNGGDIEFEQFAYDPNVDRTYPDFQNFMVDDNQFYQNGGDAPLEDQYDYQVPLNPPKRANDRHVFTGSQTYATSGDESFDIALQQNDFLNRKPLRDEDNRVIAKYKKLGYDVVPNGEGKVKFLKGKGEWQDNAITEGVNKAASFATGVGNYLQEGKQRQAERQQVNQSMTPKYFQNMEAQGLNNVPAYMEYGGDIVQGRDTYYGSGMHGEGMSYPVKQVSSGQNRQIYSQGVVNPVDRTYDDVPLPTYNRYSGTGKAIKPHYGPGYMFGGRDNTFNRQPVMEYGGWDQEGFMFAFGGEPEWMMYGGMGEGLPDDPRDMTNVEYGYQGIRSNNPYGHTSIYKHGGSVSSAKAKEILRDGTAQGHPLTPKQKRYFGWIAGGSKPRREYGGWDQEGFMMQTGGAAQLTPGVTPQGSEVNWTSRRLTNANIDQNALLADRIQEFLGNAYTPTTGAGRATLNSLPNNDPSFVNDLTTRLQILSSDPGYSKMTPEQRINAFYNTGASGKSALDQFIQKTKTLGGSPATYWQNNPANYRRAGVMQTGGFTPQEQGIADQYKAKGYDVSKVNGQLQFKKIGAPQQPQQQVLTGAPTSATDPVQKKLREELGMPAPAAPQQKPKANAKASTPLPGTQAPQDRNQSTSAGAPKQFDAKALKGKYKDNPYLTGNGNRYYWATQTSREFPLSGGNVRDAVTEAAKLNDIDPALLYSSAMEEGMSGAIDDKNYQNASQAYVNWTDENPQAAEQYPVDGFYNYGLNQFPGYAKTLEKKGYLPKGFSNQFTTFGAENEKGEAIKTAAFKTDADALKAKSAMMRLAKDQMNDYAKKQGINLTPEQQQFFMLANYNGGEGNMQKMLKSYRDKGYLKNNDFLTNTKFKPASYDQIYQNVMRRIQPANMMRTEKVFEYGGDVDYMEFGGECDDCGKKVKFKNGGAASYSNDPRKLAYYQEGGDVFGMDELGQFETGGDGKWIQKAIKHPGRCSNPGDERCPKGSPQYNLAMRFKHGDLHKKQTGGYGIGDEVDLTPAQIDQLRKAGYQIEEI